VHRQIGLSSAIATASRAIANPRYLLACILISGPYICHLAGTRATWSSASSFSAIASELITRQGEAVGSFWSSSISAPLAIRVLAASPRSLYAAERSFQSSNSRESGGAGIHALRDDSTNGRIVDLRDRRPRASENDASRHTGIDTKLAAIMEEARETMPPSSTKYQLKFGPTRVASALPISLAGKPDEAPRGILEKETGYRLPRRSAPLNCISPLRLPVPPVRLIRGKILRDADPIRWPTSSKFEDSGVARRSAPAAASTREKRARRRVTTLVATKWIKRGVKTKTERERERERAVSRAHCEERRGEAALA